MITSRHAGNEAFNRACDALRRAGCDAAILRSVENVTYVTQMAIPVPYGAMDALAYGPWLAVIDARDEQGWIVAPDAAFDTLREKAPAFEPIAFDTFDSFRPTDPVTSYTRALRTALTSAGLGGSAATIAIESQFVPEIASALLVEIAPGHVRTDANAPLQQARMIKTEREIAKLRASARLADIAHNTLARLCQTAGLNEIDMWAEIGAAVNKEAGRDLLLTGELVTGPRSATVAYPNGPRHRVTEAGDAALMDLSARFDGYWFDCSNTHVIGGVEPTAEQRRLAIASQQACEAAMSSLKPGAKASDAAAAAEAAFAAHGLPMAHYSGHQIGVSVNELPRLVPYDDTLIEPGMVFSVEPGAYQGPDGSFGARSEKMVLVTEHGSEILSSFSWGIA